MWTFSWYPLIQSALQLDSNLSLFKCGGEAITLSLSRVPVDIKKFQFDISACVRRQIAICQTFMQHFQLYFLELNVLLLTS